MNSRKVAHVKSGYTLGLFSSTNSFGGLTTLSFFGHRKKASDFLGVLLFTTALCKQLLYLPFESACSKQINRVTLKPTSKKEEENAVKKYLDKSQNTKYKQNSTRWKKESN